MKIQIKPVTLWSSNGTINANFIKFLQSSYSFNDIDMNVNYQLLNGVATPTEENPNEITYTYITGGSILVPSEIVENWVNDSEIFGYVIEILNLTKV
jgi:hypothetical protein